MGTGEFNAGGNPVMDLHPIQGIMGHVAFMQTLSF